MSTILVLGDDGNVFPVHPGDYAFVVNDVQIKEAVEKASRERIISEDGNNVTYRLDWYEPPIVKLRRTKPAG